MSYKGDDILDLAKQSMERPSDFGWFGRDEMFETWGFSGISKHRDSDLVTESNYEVASEELLEKYPEEIEDISMGHWAVGHVETMIVKVIKDEAALYKSPGQWTEDDITDAFKDCMEIVDHIRYGHPVLDEEHLSEMEYEQACKNIWNEMPAGTDIGRDEVDIVLGMLHDLHDGGMDRNYDGTGEWYDSKEIYEACFWLGRVTEEDFELDNVSEEAQQAFADWCYAVERAEIEKTQGVLFNDES